MAGYTGRNVLIVVDNSQDSEQAVDWIAVNFYKPGDELHLVHIVKDETEKLREYYQEKSLEAAANKYIQERFVPKLVAAGIMVCVDIVRRPDDDSPQGAAIVKKADEIDAAAIVMCPHEQDFHEGAFLNSVAKWVVLNSERVVTLLHPYRLGHKKPYGDIKHPAHA